MKRINKENTFRILSALRFTKSSTKSVSLAAIIAKLLCVLLLAAGCAHNQITINDKPEVVLSSPISSAPKPKRANFEQEQKSLNAQHVADWIVDSGDNNAMPFAIVDKTDARVFVFEADGRLRGSAPALVGLAKGDDSASDIGERKLSAVRPEERTTPAGRFDACLGRNAKGTEVLWVDYDGAVAIHPVVTSNPKEHRLERIASSNPAEHRISYGCINVPANFFNDVVDPTFSGKNGVAYVLPEVKSIREIFKSYYDVE